MYIFKQLEILVDLVTYDVWEIVDKQPFFIVVFINHYITWLS